MLHVVNCVLAIAVVAVVAEDNVNLLQLGSIKSSRFESNHLVTKKRSKQQKQCPGKPVEVEKEPVEKHFGCNGNPHWKVGKGTRQCSFWGMNHISSIFGDWQMHVVKDSITNPGQTTNSVGVVWQTGLYRMARAVDKSWEIQFFSCGAISAAAAMRFGNTTIEVVMPPPPYVPGSTHHLQASSPPHFLVNGVQVPHEKLPGDLPDGSFLGPHHKITFGRKYGIGNDNRYGWFTWGSCADDPSGQVRVEISSSYNPSYFNVMNILIEVAEGSYLEGPDEEKVSTCPGRSWKTAQPLDPSESLFTNPGDICATCQHVWRRFKNDKHIHGSQDVQLGEAHCKEVRRFDQAPRAEDMCNTRGVSMDHARKACTHLEKKPIFFEDCVFDVCAAGDEAAENAEAEADEEDPEPKCVLESADCDPQASCCDDDATRGLNFGNVVQNNLDASDNGPRELRYGQVISGVDLLITCPDYTSTVGNSKNGVLGVLGSLRVNAGKTHNFTFTFVESGTANPASPGNAVISFLDLDQGKKNKQRESVRICGLGSPIVTSNTELETSFADSCATATSTGRGTGKDNPDDPESMDDMQRARTIAFPLKGKSSFSVELGVSPKGRQGRLFLFTGHPTVACKD